MDWTAWVQLLTGAGILLVATASELALGPTEPPVQWVQKALSPRVKRPDREPDHSPPHRKGTGGFFTGDKL